MTGTVRPATACGESAWRELWRAYLAFRKSTKPIAPHAPSWAWIRGWAAHLFVCLSNILYHRSTWQSEHACDLNGRCVSLSGRGAALVDAVVSHAQGRNCASVYGLTTQDNIQAQRLYHPVASLTPFVKYRV